MVSSHSLGGHQNLRWKCETQHPLGNGLGERHRGERRASLASQQDKAQRMVQALCVAEISLDFSNACTTCHVRTVSHTHLVSATFQLFLRIFFNWDNFHHAAMDTHLSFYRAIIVEDGRGVEKSHDFKRVL